MPRPKFKCRIKKAGGFTPVDAFDQNRLVLAKKVINWYNWDDPNLPTEPFLAFSEKSAKAKFSAQRITPLVSRVGINNASSGDMEFSFVAFTGMVAEHYQINVGTGYGVASTLAFLAALRRWNFLCNPSNSTKEELKEVLYASPRAWEHIYEDMMLTGFNFPGFEFASVLQECVSGQKKKGDKWLSHKETLLTIQDAYIKGAGLGDPTVLSEEQKKKIIPLDEISLILMAFRITRGYSALARRHPERFPKHYGPMTFENEDFALIVLAGCFRALSQGVYGAGDLKVTEEAIFDGKKGISPWRYLQGDFDCIKDFLPPWLRERIFAGMRIHTNIASLDKAKEDYSQ